MTPEQRLDRAERMLLLLAKAGHRTRREWRERSREQDEKIDILISMHTRNEEEWRAESRATNERINIMINVMINSQLETSEQIKGLATGHDELRKSLHALINSLRKGRNGKSSN